MNKIFRIVWNRALAQLVVVSELCRGQAKGGRGNGRAAKASSPARIGHLAMGVALALAGAPLVQAHTISVGYTNNGSNALTFWYGTYHAPFEATYHEGNFHLTGPNGYDQLVSFDLLQGSKPTDLEDGTNNFYAVGNTGTTVSGTNPNQAVQTWQGVSFTGLAAGTYVYTYVPIASPTAVWQPYAPILTNTLTLSAADLNGYPLDGGLVYDENTLETTQPDSIVFNDGIFKPTVDSTKGQPVTIRAGGGTVDTTDGDVTFTGDVDGTGSLTKTGTGTLTLDGTSTYSGGTTVQQGTLQGDTDSLQGDIANNGIVEFTQNTNGTYGGSISGSGDLVKDGSGTVALTGTNTYTGLTTIDAGGALALSGNGSIAASAGVVDNGTFDISGSNSDRNVTSLSGSGAVALGNNDLNLTAAAGTFDGIIAGAGGLAVNGGSEILTGVNTYTGITTIDTGTTLTLSGNGSIVSSAGLVDNGTFDIAGSNSDQNITTLSGNGGVTLGANDLNLTAAAGTFDGIIAGTGGLAVIGGNETLTGANTYTGATTIDAGATLALSGDGSVASSAGVVANGTFDIGGANDDQNVSTLSGSGAVALGNNDLNLTAAADSFDGIIAGAGGLAVNGGSETLTGVNTYGGATTIDAGATLALSGNGSVASSVGVINNGTFDISASNDDQNVGTLSGNGGVSLGGNGINLTNASGTFGGIIAGSGGVAVNGGSELLTGANTYTGTTTIHAGATLALSGNGSVATSAGVVANGIFDISASNDDQNVTTLSGGGDVSLGNNDLNLTAAAGTFGGVVAGSGSVAVNGGSETLTGVNTYTGTTTIDAGATLSLSGSGSVAASAGLVANGTFDIGGANNDQNVATLSGNGGVALGNNDLNLTAAAGTFAGTISGNGGMAVSRGTEILSGNNTYAGGTTVNGGGTLQIGSDVSLGNASGTLTLNGGTLHTTGSIDTARDMILSGSGTIVTNAGTTVRSSGDVAGSGGLIKNGTGTLALSGIASHQGGTTVNDGTLILAGANTYTGGTIVNGGTLQISNDANLGATSGNVTLNGGTLAMTQSLASDRDIHLAGNSTVDIYDGMVFRAHGDITGSGGLIKQGGGIMVVSGSNTFSGGTLIDGGTIQINSGSSLGTGTIVLHGGTLQTVATLGSGQTVLVSGDSGVNVDGGTITVLSGQITTTGASGCFVKSGKGTLNMTGPATLSNGTCVQDGMLRANGTLDSFVTVDRLGTLRGTGLIRGPISVYGTLAPGNSPGTLTVDGTVTMYTGSTFQADIDGVGTGTGGGNYSRLLVVGQDHTFVAAGSLQPLLRGITGNASNAFTPRLGETFRIVTAEGGITGRFDQLAQPTAGLAANTRLQAFYNVFGSHSIDLRVTPTSYAIFAAGSNGNARQAGTALDSVIAAQDAGASSSRQSELLYAVAGLAESQIAGTLKALSGEVHVDQIAAAQSRDLSLQGEIADHLASDRTADSDVSRGNRVWVNLSQGGRREVSDLQGSGFNSSGSAITLGADLFRSGNAWLGVGVSHAESHTIAANGTGGINGDSAFVYGEQALGRVLLDGMAASSSDRWTTRRADPLGFAASLGSQTKGHDLTASLGLRMPFERADSMVEPFARATWQRIRRDAFTETGESASALTSADYAQSGTRFLAGLTSGSKSQDPFATSVTYRIGAALGVDQGGLAAPQLNVALGGQTMAIRTPNAGRAFVQLNANGTVLLDRHVYLYGGLTSEFGQRRSDYAVTAGLRVAL